MPFITAEIFLQQKNKCAYIKRVTFNWLTLIFILMQKFICTVRLDYVPYLRNSAVVYNQSQYLNLCYKVYIKIPFSLLPAMVYCDIIMTDGPADPFLKSKA